MLGPLPVPAPQVYDEIGRSYRATRRPDLRIVQQIHSALPIDGTVLNVGAGAGSYEPPRTIAAIEPSMVMVAQHLPDRLRAYGPLRKVYRYTTNVLTRRWPF